MLSRFWLKKKKIEKKKWIIFFDFFFFQKTFLRKLFSQNVFWIDYVSKKHKKKFFEGWKTVRKAKTWKESEYFDQVQNWWYSSSSSHLFFLFTFFLFTFFLPTQFRAPLGLRPRFAQIIYTCVCVFFFEESLAIHIQMWTSLVYLCMRVISFSFYKSS